MTDTLNKEFEDAFIGLSKQIIKETSYRPTILIQMINDRGSVATAKTLINSNKPSEGYTKLWELGALNLTVEAFVLENPKWHQLFTEVDLNKAKQRLLAFKYEIK